PNQYSIDFNAAANLAGLADVTNAVRSEERRVGSKTVPAGTVAGAYRANLTVRNSTTGCVSAVTAITVTVVALPTITLAAALPNPTDVCFDATNPGTSTLSYTATTGSPNQYSIDFNAAANLAGLADVTNAV